MISASTNGTTCCSIPSFAVAGALPHHVAGSPTRVVSANVARTITVLRTASTSSHALAPVSSRTRRWAVVEVDRQGDHRAAQCHLLGGLPRDAQPEHRRPEQVRVDQRRGLPGDRRRAGGRPRPPGAGTSRRARPRRPPGPEPRLALDWCRSRGPPRAESIDRQRRSVAPGWGSTTHPEVVRRRAGAGTTPAG
jgi:hypothetical protein